MRTAIAGVAAGILLCVGALGSARAAKVVIPLEDFTRYDEFGGVKISPDGEFLAMSSGRFGRTLISFYNLAEKQVIGAVKASGSQEIDDFEWISATRLVYFPAQFTNLRKREASRATARIVSPLRGDWRSRMISGPSCFSACARAKHWMRCSDWTWKRMKTALERAGRPR